MRDINGDGYPDLVFNQSPADGLPPPAQPNGQGAEIRVLVDGHAFGLTGPNEVDALLNVAGLRLDENSNVFSTPVALSDDPQRCGVAKWSTSNDTEKQTLVCGLADVNGDGLIDRVEDSFVQALSWGLDLGADGYDVCRAHGFAYTKTVDSWRGTAAPPSLNNVESQTTVMGIDDFGRATSVDYVNDVHRSDDDYCVDTVYAQPTGTVPRVLSAPASRRIWDCSKGGTATLAMDYWQYDALPSGNVSLGLLTSHTLERHATDNGALLETIRAFDATYDTAGNISTVVQVREDGATRTTTLDYDPFGLMAVHSRTAGAATAALDSYVSVDPVSLQTLAVTDANGTQRGTQYDGFARPIISTVTPPGGTVGALATYAYSGFAGGNPSGRSVSMTQFTDPVPLADVGTATGRVATLFLDELGRERFTQLLLGADYGNETMITGQRLYDVLGRVLFEADPHPASQPFATAYGTTHWFYPDGSPYVFIRGQGPQPFTMAPDASKELYPTLYAHSFADFQEQVSVRDPDSLTAGSPQAGVIHAAISSAVRCSGIGATTRAASSCRFRSRCWPSSIAITANGASCRRCSGIRARPSPATPCAASTTRSAALPIPKSRTTPSPIRRR